MQEDKKEFESRWQAANKALDDLSSAAVPDDDPRVKNLLGELDLIEYEVGMMQRRESKKE